MNKLTIPAVIVATGMVAAAAWSQAPPQGGSGFQAKPYFVMPLEKDPSRQVRLQSVIIPAGGMASITSRSSEFLKTRRRPPRLPP